MGESKRISHFSTISAALGASERLQNNWKYTYQAFTATPTFSDGDGDGAAGASGVNLCQTDRNLFEYNMLGTQTLTIFSLGSAGLDVSLDQTDNDGVEITQGITSVSRAAFTVGTDEFFAACKFTIADVSGTDDCAFGFRKAEAYQANIDDYDEMAALNVISGNINIETILNGGATTTTDTTDNWADAEAHTLEVRVDLAGRVVYLIDGALPTTTAAFTFDASEIVLPFFYFLHASDVAGAVQLQTWEVGTFESRGLENIVDLDN